MNIDFINPFVEASYEILKEVLQCEIKREDIYLQSRVSNIKGIAALIGLLGEVEGRLILDMSTETAIKIASRMTQENFNQVDDMVINVITEIANMITANAIPNFIIEDIILILHHQLLLRVMMLKLRTRILKLL